MKSPCFANQYFKEFFFNEKNEEIQKVGFDQKGAPVYMETKDKKQDLVHLRGFLPDATFFAYRQMITK